ncbi:hypothetical protein L0F51_05980 [Afifella sp. H1R]|uniref:COG3904 family protein n=1 Tax=Afifella sp. H1R TaxID=2908841 RepID=UPI001F2C7138|nr:hypothetical protein [Afifella sp. H1R]MCF1503308.1 hypothetical protein [Afifella sp. H1R]
MSPPEPSNAGEAVVPETGFAERIRQLPEGTILKGVFFGLVALSVAMVGFDLKSIVEERRADPFVNPAREPVTMPRPAPGDQVRPYLPQTRPVSPDRDGVPRRQPPRSFEEAEPVRFRALNDETISMEGTIVPGSAGEFERFLQDNEFAAGTEVLLHSPGGSVADAMSMARQIREHEFNTRIATEGYCASSCPLVFASGVERHAGKKAWIGVHQIYAMKGADALGSLSDGFDQAQRVSAEAQALLIDFGVDPRVWIHAMETPKNQLYLFTPEELADYRLVTDAPDTDASETAAARQ